MQLALAIESLARAEVLWVLRHHPDLLAAKSKPVKKGTNEKEGRVTATRVRDSCTPRPSLVLPSFLACLLPSFLPPFLPVPSTPLFPQHSRPLSLPNLLAGWLAGWGEEADPDHPD